MLAAMRDEQYASEELPSYGAHEQPAIVSRTRRHLRTTLIGTVVAALGLVSAVVALATYPDIEGVFQGEVEAKETVLVERDALAEAKLCANDVIVSGSFDP